MVCLDFRKERRCGFCTLFAVGIGDRKEGGRWMDDDLVLVPKEDAKLLMELHRISEKGKGNEMVERLFR